MPVVPMRQILDAAFADRYGVAAINIVDDLSLEAVLAAAAELESPLIVQTSVKTVKAIGAECPVRDVAGARGRRCRSRCRCTSTTARTASGSRSACARAGTRCCSTALSSTSRRTRARRSRWSPRRTATARRWRARSRACSASRTASAPTRPARCTRSTVSAKFIEDTGVYSFAPAIGTAHGLYKGEPKLTPERVTEIVDLHPIPQVLHGGTGLTEAQFTDLIARGCAKVNISTALKIAFVDAHREYLEANPGKHDPPSLLKHVRSAVKDDGGGAHPDIRLGRKGDDDDVSGRLTACRR